MIWAYGYQNIDERKLISDKDFSRPTIITNINGEIIAVNLEWEKMCKFHAHEAFGNTPKILQGPLTNLQTAQAFANGLKSGYKVRCSLINYTKDQRIFINKVYGWHLGDIFIAETCSEHFINVHHMKLVFKKIS